MSKLLKRSLVLAVVLVAVFAIGAVASAASGDVDYATKTVDLDGVDYYQIIKGKSAAPIASSPKWQPVWNGSLDISSVIPKGDAVVTVFTKTGDTVDSTGIEIAAIPATPKLKLDEVFDVVDNTTLIPTGTVVYEYKLVNSGWADASELDVSSRTGALKLQIRVKSDDAPASAAQTITIPAPAKAPAVKYDTANDTISGLKAGYEFTLDISSGIASATWTGITADDLKPNPDGTPNDYKEYARTAFGLTADAAPVYVRVAATEGKPASAIATVQFPKVADAPDNTVFAYGTDVDKTAEHPAIDGVNYIVYDEAAPIPIPPYQYRTVLTKDSDGNVVYSAWKSLPLIQKDMAGDGTKSFVFSVKALITAAAADAIKQDDLDFAGKAVIAKAPQEIEIRAAYRAAKPSQGLDEPLAASPVFKIEITGAAKPTP